MITAIYITSFGIIFIIWAMAYILEKKLDEIKKEIENLKQKTK